MSIDNQAMLDGQAALWWSAERKKGVDPIGIFMPPGAVDGGQLHQHNAPSRDLLQKRGRPAFYYKNAVGLRVLLQYKNAVRWRAREPTSLSYERPPFRMSDHRFV